MKYMGSKRWQLTNGLGRRLRKVVEPGDTFVDLFAGSGSVAWFAASELRARVIAVDLQYYAAALSGAVIKRARPVNPQGLVDAWLTPARAQVADEGTIIPASRRALARGLTESAVLKARRTAWQSNGVFLRSYGGHYFSLEQAHALDLLRTSLPTRPQEAALGLAALIAAASRCSASPGHTAQPFQPTGNALPHIQTIWSRDLIDETERVLRELAPLHATIPGRAVVADANEYARKLTGNEVVFLDPPYSAAQYSRFYHVLEAVALGGYDDVSGAGRSPSLGDRARSEFSCVSGAHHALQDLLARLGTKGCRVVATFPQHRASNGLSGEEIASSARNWFDVDVDMTPATFSTLGGNGARRSARHRSHELVITMYPR